MTQASKLGYFSSSNFVLLTPNRVKTGLEFFSNSCNSRTASFLRGLQNLHPPVQIWVLPSAETPQSIRDGGFVISAHNKLNGTNLSKGVAGSMYEKLERRAGATEIAPRFPPVPTAGLRQRHAELTLVYSVRFSQRLADGRKPLGLCETRQRGEESAKMGNHTLNQQRQLIYPLSTFHY
jgi:hypothetical protein